MSFMNIPGVGVVHIQEVRRARVVPAHERHKWNRVPERGQVATCKRCGCQKCFRLNYEIVYRQAGGTEILTDRPACTGRPTIPNL